MLRTSAALRRLSIHATDGELGRVTEFYFDDERWTVRYLVVRTGSWLSGRDVLLTPAVITGCNWEANTLDVSLTTEQVRESPDVSTDRPVSRRQELEYLEYYDQPPYWMLGSEIGGAAVALDAAMRTAATESEAAGVAPRTHLRSSQEVVAYRLEATDGGIGHVRAFVIDDKTWRVRYLVVDTGTWWHGRKVVFAPEWVDRVSWGERCLHVGLTRDQIKTAPPYPGPDGITTVYEAALEAHYGKKTS
jgi:hypothetical protein